MVGLVIWGSLVMVNLLIAIIVSDISRVIHIFLFNYEVSLNVTERLTDLGKLNFSMMVWF